MIYIVLFYNSCLSVDLYVSDIHFIIHDYVYENFDI